MTDVETARLFLAGHSICICKDGQCRTSDRRGIAPLLEWLPAGEDLRGFSVADKIVGKAAALLFVFAGICAVHAQVLSEAGEAVLRAHGIPYTCATRTKQIINRRGDGICPMESAVLDTNDPQTAYHVLTRTVALLGRESGTGEK